VLICPQAAEIRFVSNSEMSVRTPAFPKEGIAQTYIQFEGNPIYGAPQTTNFQFNLMLKASAGDKEPDYDPPKGKPHLFEKANTHHYSAKEGQIFIPYHPSVDGPLTKRLLEEVVQRPGYQKMKFTQLMVAAFVGDVSLVKHLLRDNHNRLQRDSSGRTALWWAAKGWASDVMVILPFVVPISDTLQPDILCRNLPKTDARPFLEEVLDLNVPVAELELEGKIGGEESDATVATVAKILATNSSLSLLDLRGNETGDEGAARLADALRVNSSLSSLLLKGNNIGNNGAAMITEALSSSITSLDLSRNNIGKEGAARIAKALRVNSSLAFLGLKRLRFGDEEAAMLAEALWGNYSLSKLKLSRNMMGDEGAARIAEALCVNSSLSALYLGDNKIGDEGAARIADALCLNSSLSSLDLKRNHIGDEGGVRIAEALYSNSSLSALELRGNKTIGDVTAMKLAEAWDEVVTQRRISGQTPSVSQEPTGILYRLSLDELKGAIVSALPTPLYSVPKHDGNIKGKGADSVGGANWGCEVTLNNLTLVGDGQITVRAACALSYWIEGRASMWVKVFGKDVGTPPIYGSAGVGEPLRHLMVIFDIQFPSVNQIVVTMVGCSAKSPSLNSTSPSNSFRQ